MQKYMRPGWAPAAVNWLAKVRDEAKNLAATGPLGIFGTANAAAWIFQELDGVVEFFVDEDMNKVGRQFLDRTVYHPSNIDDGSGKYENVYIPLPFAMAKSISGRLSCHNTRYHLPPIMRSQLDVAD